MKGLSIFINTKAGLLILGFLLTTGFGTVLNFSIQYVGEQRERKFEMYKTRLAEAKALQDNLLSLSTARIFYLEQILEKLEHPSEDIIIYWKEKYSGVKDDWNKNLVIFHAKMSILFQDNLAGLLFSECEYPIATDGLFEKNLQLSKEVSQYERNLPATLHGAFVDAHDTIYHMTFVCQEGGHVICNNWSDIKNLAYRQMEYLKGLHGCFSSGISNQLLVDPYGPRKEASNTETCKEILRRATNPSQNLGEKFGARQCG